MSGGSPVGNALSNSQQQTPMGGGTSPLNTGGGFSGGFGGGQQLGGGLLMPAGGSPFSSVNSTTQQDMMRGGSGMPFGQRLGQLGFGGQQMPNAGSQFNAAQNPGADQFKVPDWVQAPEPGTMTTQAFKELTNPATGEKFMAPSGGYSVRQQPDSSMVAEEYPMQSFGDMQYRPQRYDPIAAEQNYYAQMAKQHRPQQPPPMQNPFQPQQPSYMQDPEYQGYDTQARDLSRQMDEYMKKAPMYQQLQDLQGKMAPFQQRHQQQELQRMQQMQAMQQRQFQQPSPFRGGSFSQNFAPYQSGLQSLMGQLRGRPASRPAGMQAAFPQSFGREQRYSVPAYSADYSGVRAAPAPAPAPEPAPAYDYNQSNSGW